MGVAPGRKYRSTIDLNHHIITAFNFDEIGILTH